MNISDSSSQASMTFRTVAAAIYSVVAVAGLLGYFLYCYVVLKNFKTLSNTFYLLTISCAIPECISNFLVLIYAMPAMVATGSGDSQELVPVWVQDFFGFLSDYTWFCICAHMVLIAGNRSIAVKWPVSYNRLFSTGRTVFLLVGSYWCAFFVPAVTYGCGCRFEFVQLAWTVWCDGSRPTCYRVVPLLDSILTNTQIGFVLLCDAFVLCYVRKKNKTFRVMPARTLRLESLAPIISQIPSNTVQVTPAAAIQQQQHRQAVAKRRARRECSLILQFTSMAGVLVLGEIAFWVLPDLAEKGYISEQASGFASEFFLILTTSINPLLYFVFSSEIRHFLTRWKHDNGSSDTAAPRLDTRLTAFQAANNMEILPKVDSD